MKNLILLLISVIVALSSCKKGDTYICILATGTTKDGQTLYQTEYKILKKKTEAEIKVYIGENEKKSTSVSGGDTTTIQTRTTCVRQTEE